MVHPQNSYVGKRRLHFLPIVTLLALAFSLSQTRVAWAAIIDVPCSATDLVTAIDTANTNGEEDTLNLADPCTYILTEALPDITSEIVINGNGANIDGSASVRPFLIMPDGILTLSNLTVQNGSVPDSGAGIFNNSGTLTLTNTTLSNNTTTGFGGGIFNIGGTLTLNDSIISGNTATGGGGIFHFSGTLTLNDSTVSNNTAPNNGGGISVESGTVIITNSTFAQNDTDAVGGGINNSNGTLNLTNSTIASNGAQFHAGIFNFTGTLTLVNSTVANNEAQFVGGIGNSLGTFNLGNSIIANNTGGDCSNGATLNPSGGNLIGDGSCAIPGAISGDPLLGAFSGAYFPLEPGSPAIDTGDNGICPGTDQRGVARPFDGDGDGTATCDLGSYEVDTPPPTTPPSPTPETTPTQSLVPPPPTPLCEDHNFSEGGVVRSSTADALGYAINCRVLYENGGPTQWLGGDLYNAGSIGIQGVLDLGVIQAVDIFSPVGMNYFEGGAVFCLRGEGTLIWLAAKNAPRIAEIIGSYTVDDFPGFTCATLFEPGTLVLVRDRPQ